MDRSAGASSTSRPRRSPVSPPSAPASSTSGSRGSGPGRSALKALARRHGIRPSKTLGQNFLADPNLARAIVSDAGVGPGDRVVEVGAGLGSITVPLAAAGAEVVALEFDRALADALAEVLAPYPNVRQEAGDALRVDWDAVLGEGDWKMVSNLPYNIAVPLLLDMLERVPRIREYVVVIQREVGDRLVASAGDEAYGAVSLRVAYRARAALVRRIPPEVFWPRPKVGSVLVRLTPQAPPVNADPDVLFLVIEEAFGERRKTMTNALRRLGLEPVLATRILKTGGVDPSTRPEDLALEDFARIAEALVREGVPLAESRR
ncbi:MAG TPA: 16S rRNA (adenine(1518)-N(6)/adenine(1519)-N(6))-dimethyltransferase RsmA [Actinomycetota bacterium]